MDKGNLELFKQAISEGLSEKLDSVVNSYTDEIVCSEKHRLAMRTIVYGKAETKGTWSPRMKHIIAIIVAAALLLTSCAVIFRNEICEIVGEFFAKYVYSGDETGMETIEEVYELTYLPEGYTFENKIITPLCVQYILVDENDNAIIFEQRILDKSGFTVNSEKGYSKIEEIEKYSIFYRYTETFHSYIWNDGKYAFELSSTQRLSNEDIELIIQGIK